MLSEPATLVLSQHWSLPWSAAVWIPITTSSSVSKSTRATVSAVTGAVRL